MLSFFAEFLVSATLTPMASGSYVDGIWVETADTPSTILIIMPQPLCAEELDMLPAGEFVHNYLKTWTSASLGLWGFSSAPYIITYGGKTYKVMQVDSWDTYDTFKRVIIREQKTNE